MSKLPPSRWRKIPRYATITLAVLALVAAAYVLLWHWPQQAGEDLGLGPESSQEVRHQVQELENARVATGAQLFLGLGILVGIYLTYRRIRATERQADVAQRQEITSRFTQAIEQLGSGERSIRLGGIYALEKIAQDEPEAYFNQFREVLSAFVRETAREPHVDEDGERTPLATDLQAALSVLGRRPPQDAVDDPARIDWSGAHLEGADLYGAHLEGAVLYGAHLEDAHLQEAHLQRAVLYGAHLEGADLRQAALWGAHLQGAHLMGARFPSAGLLSAHLEGADFREAHLEGADLYGAHLEGADLRGARLIGASLAGAHLASAHLEGAHLNHAYLGGASLEEAHLNGAFLSDARYDHRTRFPAGFEPSERGLILVGEDAEEGSDS